jgi:hypothetical protein
MQYPRLLVTCITFPFLRKFSFHVDPPCYAHLDPDGPNETVSHVMTKPRKKAYPSAGPENGGPRSRTRESMATSGFEENACTREKGQGLCNENIRDRRARERVSKL